MDKNQQAWQRGVRMASLWKKLKASVLHFDNRCVTWVKRKNLPAWVGHLPTVLACMLLLASMVMGSALIAFSLALVFSLAFIIEHVRHNACIENDDSEGSSSPLSEYRDGDQGFGLYCGSYRIDEDD